MKRIRIIAGYSLLVSLIFIIDRVSKLNALTYCINRCKLNQFISFEFVINRGISWGMLHTQNNMIFGIVTMGIVSLTTIVGFIMYIRWKRHQPILGELLVFTGSISNILDRALYGGVIDFIELSYKNWSWPIFNIADVCIVIGVALMLIQSMRES